MFDRQGIKFIHFNNSFIQFSTSITEYPVSRGQFLMETLQKCGRKAKRKIK